MHLYSARFVTELLRVSAGSAVNDDDVVEPPPPSPAPVFDRRRADVSANLRIFVFETECHMSGDGVTRCYLLETEISICDGNYRRLKEQQNARQLNHVSTRCAYSLPLPRKSIILPLLVAGKSIPLITWRRSHIFEKTQIIA